MPVNKTIRVNNDRILAIWHIEESFDQLINWLNPIDEDRSLLFSFGSEKKRLEWLCGRLTLKHLTQLFGLEYYGLRKDDHGKPTLRENNYEISLTHSFPYVAAIIDPVAPVGIDLEQPRDKVLKIAPKFLNTEELTFAQNDVRILNIMWCVKESLYKIYGKKGLSLKEHLSIKPFDVKTPDIITGNIIVNDTLERYKLQCIIEDRYILTYNL